MTRKKGKEAKFERATWFAMILVFALLRFDRDLSFPEFLVPLIIGAILIASGVYQITQKWPVSPFTWMIAILLILLTVSNPYLQLPVDLIFAALVATVAHIIIGIVSNES